MNVFNIDNINALGDKTVVTVGMFDGLHLGHRHLLARLLSTAVEEGLLPVVVTFDTHPRQVLDPAMTMPLLSTRSERLSLLEGCGVTNVAMVHFDVNTASLSACAFARRFLCERLNMSMLLLGYDNMFGSRANNDFDRLPELAAEKGFAIRRDEAVLLDGIEVSSTKIRKALQEGNLVRANAMLGAPYGVCGTVVHGRHVGTSLGFPTANIRLDENAKILPADGVYALRVMVDGSAYAAMANLGNQPTFNQQHKELEVHLIGFDGNLYGRELRVEFIGRIRDIRAFGSPDELVAQLRRDKQEAIAITCTNHNQ
ncbi:MAG: riboflavin biosynthesis protein RibF [Bacteroidales bacterium]|nr:riboflavin biosynthesis protein RibF [Bacteroidales bacterium]